MKKSNYIMLGILNITIAIILTLISLRFPIIYQLFIGIVLINNVIMLDKIKITRQ